MNDELIYIMSKLQEKSIKYKSQKRLQCCINDDEYYSYILFNHIRNLKQENQQLKAENYRLEHNEKVLLQREERAINYIDQVIGYKPCAREISEELNTLIGILGGGNNE